MTRKEWAKTITAAGAMLLCWGTAPVAINFLNNTFSLVFQAFTRYALSMVLLWIYQKMLLCREDWEDLWHLVPRHLPWIVLAGFLTFVFQLFFTATYFYLAPGFANLLYQNQVVFSLFMGMLFFSEERAVLKNRFFYLGLGAVVTGVILVIRSRFGGISGSLDPRVFFPLGAGLAWSFVGVTVKKRLSPVFPNGFSTSLVFTVVTFFMFIALLIEPGPMIHGTPAGSRWVILLGTGFAGVGVGHTLFYYVVPRLGVSLTGGLQLMVPFIAGITSFLVLGETVKPLQVGGGILLLGGCALLLRTKGKATKEQTPL